METATIRVLGGAAGVAAPLIFTALIIWQGVLQPDYSHVSMPVSALAAWPHGYLQHINFAAFGLLMTAYAVGLHFGIAPARGGWLGPLLLIVSGIGILIAGIYPWARVVGEFVEPVGHAVGSFMAFVGAGAGLIAIAVRMRGDANWRDLSNFAAASGAAVLVLFGTVVVMVLGFGETAGVPQHPWLGLGQRIVLAVWLLATLILALRLIRAAPR